MRYQDGVFMSKKDQQRHAVIEDYRAGRLSREDAGLKLNLSERQISRIAAKVSRVGLGGVKHGNCGKVPWNKKPDEIIESYIDLYKTKFSQFNFLHALEMIDEEYNLEKIDYSTFYRACRKEGLGKMRKRRSSKARRARERSAEEGYMLQMDGSPHKWNGKDEWALVATIDDATSDIPFANLFDSETTWACMNVLHEVIKRKGVPEFILTDKAGWSSGAFKRQNFSQFERACRELGITVITTSSPEAKGRVERLNRTWQDRLIAELDYYSITKQADCNRYIEESFLPSWREKFTVPPRFNSSRYRAPLLNKNLRDIFCIKKDRVVNRDHTISYKGKTYRLDPSLTGSLKDKTIAIHEYEDGSLSSFYGDRKVPHELFFRPTRRWKRAG